MNKHTLTVAAEDLSPETLGMLERGDIITDAALAEIRAQASPLAGREGWELDEDGHSHYRPRTYRLGDVLRAEAEACYLAAVEHGYEGTREDYELTREDCDSIVAALGCRPTREEWAEAGWPFVGSAHVAEVEEGS